MNICMTVMCDVQKQMVFVLLIALFDNNTNPTENLHLLLSLLNRIKPPLYALNFISYQK